MRGNKLALPIRATHGALVRKAVPALIFGGLALAMLVSCSLNLVSLPIFVDALLPLLVFFTGVFAALVLAMKVRSADILLDKEYVTVKPVKILGLGRGKGARYKLSDFASLTAQSEKQGPYDINWVVLRARKGRDLFLDVPSGLKPEIYMYQLSRTLDLEVDHDA